MLSIGQVSKLCLSTLLLILGGITLYVTPAVGQICAHDGDINQDGSRTPADALLAFRHFLGLTVLNNCAQDHANVLNPEHTAITPSDARCIFLHFLSLPSCLDLMTFIESVIPLDVHTRLSSNVDAIQNICRNALGTILMVEPFADHNAEITFFNTGSPAVDERFDVHLEGYSVTYRLNHCPAAARGCPPLTGFTVQESLIVPAGETATALFPFVPLRVKDEYVSAGGEAGIAAPSYIAMYTFTARTFPLNDTFVLQSSAAFTITNFDNCP